MNPTLIDPWTVYLPWIIAAQLVLVFGIIALLMYFFNRQLKRRNQKLIIKTRQLLAQQKQKMANILADELPTATGEDPQQIKEVDNAMPALLSQALAQTEARLKDLQLDMSTANTNNASTNNANTSSANPKLTAEQKTAMLRLHFLNGETQALPFLDDSTLFWQTLAQNFDPIFQFFQPPSTDETSNSQSLSEKNIADLFNSMGDNSSIDPAEQALTADTANSPLLSPEALEDAFSAMGVSEGSAAEQSDTPQARIKRHVKGLTQLIDQQRLSLDALEKIRMVHSEPHQHEFIKEYQEQVRQMERLLDESEGCIKTLESEVEKAHQKITQLESRP